MSNAYRAAIDIWREARRRMMACSLGEVMGEDGQVHTAVVPTPCPSLSLTASQ
jgi:hypothetical protein